MFKVSTQVFDYTAKQCFAGSNKTNFDLLIRTRRSRRRTEPNLPLTHQVRHCGSCSTSAGASERDCSLPCHVQCERCHPTWKPDVSTPSAAVEEPRFTLGARRENDSAVGAEVACRLPPSSPETVDGNWFFFLKSLPPKRAYTGDTGCALPSRLLSGRAGRCHFMPYDYSQPHVSLNEPAHLQLPSRWRKVQVLQLRLSFSGLTFKLSFSHSFTLSTHLLRKNWGQVLVLQCQRSQSEISLCPPWLLLRLWLPGVRKSYRIHRQGWEGLKVV